MENSDELIRIARLIAKDLLGNTDEAEKAFLENWRKQKTAHEQLYQSLRREENFAEYEKQRSRLQIEKQWKKFEKRTGTRQRIAFYWYPAASVAALLILALLLFHPEENISPENINRATIANNIVPGSAKAVLILSDGQHIELPENKEEKLQFKGIEISHNQVKIKNSPATAQTPVRQNQIITPRGGEYYLILADGTSVFINSESRLEFPDQFSDDKREVYLEGEAYFSVASGKDCPFIVKTSRMNIKVTGTEFNVKAYEEDLFTQTTLVRGEVQVVSGGKTCKLLPFHQAEYNTHSGEMMVKEVDVNPFIAWKNGQFLFKGDRLEDIMTVLSRWYDFEVVYSDNELKDIVFAGKLKRSGSIGPILDVIRSTRKIKVEIKEKQILFSRK